MTATAATGYTHAGIAAAIQTAIADYIATIQLGQTLYYWKLFTIIGNVPGVLDVTGLTLNGGTADLVATPQQAVVAGTVAVN
jgi:uncharacterized phage protein gp47/JayE